MKGGVIEVADIVGVNKADRANADKFASEIMSLLLIGRKTEWQVPVVTTRAIGGVGITELYQEIV